MRSKYSLSSKPLFTLKKEMADDLNTTRSEYRKKSCQKLQALNKSKKQPNILLMSGIFEVSQYIFRNSLAFKNPQLASVHKYKHRLHFLLKKSHKQKDLIKSKSRQLPSSISNYQYIRSQYLKK